MALRRIRTEEDEILRKKSRTVDRIDERIITLLEDMSQTMYQSKGVGLAAPQVGVLKRIAVIDIGEGLIELINPIVVSQEGEQHETEGCLSVPGIFGIVKRPQTVKVKAMDRKGKEIEITGSELLAVALCHEIDHLEGILFTDKVERYIDNEEKDNK